MGTVAWSGLNHNNRSTHARAIPHARTHAPLTPTLPALSLCLAMPLVSLRCLPLCLSVSLSAYCNTVVCVGIPKYRTGEGENFQKYLNVRSRLPKGNNVLKGAKKFREAWLNLRPTYVRGRYTAPALEQHARCSRVVAADFLYFWR